MQILQFIPLKNPEITGRLLSSFKHTSNVAVFDLEDSFWVPGFPQQSQELKVWAREQIFRFCAGTADRHEGIRFGVRVNPVGTDCFRLDLGVVKVLRESLALEFLILPKVEKGSELQSCRTALLEAELSEVEIVPILESQVAFDNVDEILNSCRSAAVKQVIYGHHDYSLDAGHWPVSGADTFEYWEIIRFILAKIEQAGLHYIHPPIRDLKRVAQLRASIGRLRALASREFAILSAGPSQTSVLESLLLESPTENGMLPSLHPCRLNESEKKRLAADLTGLFEANKRPEFSFAVDAKTGRFISPHEYIAALKYLGAREGSHV